LQALAFTAFAAAAPASARQLPQQQRSCWGSCRSYGAAAGAVAATTAQQLQLKLMYGICNRILELMAMWQTHTHSSNIFHIMFSLL